MAIQDLARLIGGKKQIRPTMDHRPFEDEPPILTTGGGKPIANNPLLNIPTMLPQEDDATAYAESRGPVPVPTDVTVQGKEALVPRSLIQPEAAESASPASGV